MKIFARTVLASALAVVLVPMTPAFAEQPRGFYMGVGTGDAEANISTGDMDALFRSAFAANGASYNPQKSTIEASDSTLYVFAGYRIFPFLSAEGGYVDLGTLFPYTTLF